MTFINDLDTFENVWLEILFGTQDLLIISVQLLIRYCKFNRSFQKVFIILMRRGENVVLQRRSFLKQYVPSSCSAQQWKSHSISPLLWGLPALGKWTWWAHSGVWLWMVAFSIELLCLDSLWTGLTSSWFITVICGLAYRGWGWTWL